MIASGAPLGWSRGSTAANRTPMRAKRAATSDGREAAKRTLDTEPG
jgi:hypothetical protein